MMRVLFKPTYHSKLFNTNYIICRNVTKIHVDLEYPLVDDKLKITISGLSQTQKVTVMASVTEGKNSFSSSACFIADRAGLVKVDKYPSFGGTYKGVNSMGLFTTMIQNPGHRRGQRYIKLDVTSPQIVNFSVFNGHITWDECHHATSKIIVCAEKKRWFLDKTVQREEIRYGKLRGTMFTPVGPGPFPGVIDLFGTAGSLIEFRAAMLASRGFVTYALPYLNMEDLPKELKDIDFNYLMESVKWFCGLKKVDKTGIGMVGVSKGGEIAFMLACECPQIKSVVTINGAPVCSYSPLGPFTNFLRVDTTDYKYDESGMYVSPAFIKRFKPEHVLKIWETTAKVLYIVGEDDQFVDPKFSKILYNLYPENERHKLIVKSYPNTGKMIVWGGKMEEHVAAQEDSWHMIQNFLKSTLT